jgi:hypothetical protein
MYSVFDTPGDEDRGISILRSYIEFNPDDGYAHLGLAELYARKGMQKEHVGEMEKASTLFGFPKVANEIVTAYSAFGYQAALRAWAVGLDHYGVHRPVMVAQAYARLGERNVAFDWLERAYSERDDDMVFLNSDPVWDPLRSAPRFKDLVRRVGLPPQI